MKKSLGYAILEVAYQGSFHMEGAIYGCHRKAGNAHGIGLHRLLENNGNMLENVALIYDNLMLKINNFKNLTVS
jgi:hypothetical protein